ncbi:THAP domain-containing protein 2-like isoform X2 [Cimex lectularius]|uniref:THAP-type domain-containing protein n=1 Tax=Cimex lectularius TaxID=79782 RepID=A0A8I6RFL6_CIMLE|nr:THAP domain-containing protein 2-like isoform X2 [Cimex lectularius]
MVYCVAYGCKNRDTDKLPGVTFHKFPKNEKRRAAWAKAVKRKNWYPTPRSNLCSVHFEEEFIDRTSLAVVRLRENAIPTIFPQHPSYQQDTLGKQKSVKRKASDQMPLNEEDDDDQSNLYEVHSINETEFEENQGMDPIGEGESNSELIKKTIASLERAKDEYTSFGEFVAHELRCINSVLLRKKLKRVIQKTILEIVEEDEQNQ